MKRYGDWYTPCCIFFSLFSFLFSKDRGEMGDKVRHIYERWKCCFLGFRLLLLNIFFIFCFLFFFCIVVFRIFALLCFHIILVRIFDFSLIFILAFFVFSYFAIRGRMNKLITQSYATCPCCLNTWHLVYQMKSSSTSYFDNVTLFSRLMCNLNTHVQRWKSKNVTMQKSKEATI